MYKKILIKNFSSISVLVLSNYLFPLITLPYLLRVLGPGKYGLMNFAVAFTSYFGMLSDYGFNLTASREISINRKDDKKLEEIFSSIISIKAALFLLSSILFLILVSNISIFYDLKEIYIITFCGLLGQLLFPFWFFQGIEKMYYITVITITVRILATISIFLFIKTEEDLILLVSINSLTYILIGIISICIIFKKFSIRFVQQSYSTLKFYLKDGFSIFISSLSVNFYATSTVFLLGLLAGEKFVGYFSAADKIRLAVQNIFSAVTQAIYPHLANLFKSSLREGFILVKKVVSTAGTVNLLVCSLLFLFADQLMTIVAGKDYELSITILRITAFLPFIIFLSNIIGIQVMLNLGYKGAFTKIISSASLVSLALSIVLIPEFKANGTAITVLITELFVTLSFIIFFKKKVRLKEIMENGNYKNVYP